MSFLGTYPGFSDSSSWISSWVLFFTLCQTGHDELTPEPAMVFNMDFEVSEISHSKSMSNRTGP